MHAFADDRGFVVPVIVDYRPDCALFEFLDALGAYDGVVVPSLKHLDGLERAVTQTGVLLTVYQRLMYPKGWEWPAPDLLIEQKEGPWRS